jgi:hypothetical protein
MHLLQQETEELLSILLMPAAHVPKARELANDLVNELWNKGLPVFLELIRLESHPQLVFVVGGVDNTELFHKHDKRINHWEVALEAVRRSLSNVVQELVERHARNQNLKDRVHIAHVTGVDKSSRFKKGYFVTVLRDILSQVL